MKWIDRLESTDNLNTSYEFKLLFRGSRDGLTGDKFHEICDGQSRTVTIVKVKGTSEILGGYNPVAWKSDNSYSATKDSFIFSFKNNDSIENHILSRVINKKRAIENFSMCGPFFGNCDLSIWKFMGYGDSISKKDAYEKPIRETKNKFIAEECEVFQIV